MSQPLALSTLYFEFIGKSEAPMILHRWSYMSMLGAAIGRRFLFRHGHSTIRPNLYTIFVAEPGSRKSTAIKIAKRLVQAAGYKRCAADKTTKEGFLIWMDGTHNKEDVKKRQDQDVKAFALDMLEGVSSDAPREAFACADELYNFLGMRNMDFITLLGELWDYEGIYEYKIRNGKDVRVPYPVVSLLGGCTFETFSLTFPPESIGTGFMSRTVLVHCDPLGDEHKITWPEPPDPLKEEGLLLALNLLLSLDPNMECVLGLSKEAMTLLDSIYRSGIGVDDLRFTHYNSRRFSILLKLALICYVDRILVECPESLYDDKAPKELTRDDVIFAHTVLCMTEQGMPRSLGEFGASKFAKVQNKIIEILRSSTSPVQIQELWRLLMKDLDKMTELMSQLSTLTMAKMIVHIEGAGYTYIEPRKQQQQYVDWSLLTEQEQEHYAPVQR